MLAHASILAEIGFLLDRDFGGVCYIKKTITIRITMMRMISIRTERATDPFVPSLNSGTFGLLFQNGNGGRDWEHKGGRYKVLEIMPNLASQISSEKHNFVAIDVYSHDSIARNASMHCSVGDIDGWTCIAAVATIIAAIYFISHTSSHPCTQ